jgi:hypothetical protein
MSPRVWDGHSTEGMCEERWVIIVLPTVHMHSAMMSHLSYPIYQEIDKQNIQNISAWEDVGVNKLSQARVIV